MPQKVKKKGRDRKEPFIEKFQNMLTSHRAVFFVGCNNIGSKHMQKIRRSLRGRAHFIMGKNTLMRRAIKQKVEEYPEWKSLIPYIKGNVGLVFTNDDLYEVKDYLTTQKVAKAAKVGTYAPQEVMVPKGGTGLEPTKTSFLQALNIASRINRGQIEILQDVVLIKQGQKVGSSEATLLQMLDMKPFLYGLICNYVYEEGTIYQSRFLDIPHEEIFQKFAASVSTVAAISLAIGLPTVASVPHAILNGYKNLLAIVLETEYMFERAKVVKEMVENPDAYITPVVQEEVPEEKAEEPPQEDLSEDKEESGDMGFKFFESSED